MAREPNDAWMALPPLDRLAGVLSAPSPSEVVDPRHGVSFSLYVRGAEAIFVAEGGDEEVEAKFRFNRRSGAWQMFRRDGSRWIADGPPSARIGRLLEGIILVMQGAEPRAVFPEVDHAV